MNKYINLIMGLVSGIALMSLNNQIVHSSIMQVLTLFGLLDLTGISNYLVRLISIIMIILSFLGIIITVVFSILILKNVITERKSIYKGE